MTRLIDVDGTISVMKQQAGCATCDNYNGIRCRACQWDDAITSVYDYADYHTVEAIPIEYLENIIGMLKNHYEFGHEETREPSYYGFMTLESVINGWRERDESD